MKGKSVEQIVVDEGFYVSTSCGVSMKPFLRDRRDTVVISSVEGRLKKYDVVLYRRKDEYVLHRIIKVLPDSYVICGDNCVNTESGIKDADIIGRLTAVYRGKKSVKMSGILYGLYCRAAVLSRPLRVLLFKIKCRFKS